MPELKWISVDRGLMPCRSNIILVCRRISDYERRVNLSSFLIGGGGKSGFAILDKEYWALFPTQFYTDVTHWALIEFPENAQRKGSTEKEIKDA